MKTVNFSEIIIITRKLVTFLLSYSSRRQSAKPKLLSGLMLHFYAELETLMSSPLNISLMWFINILGQKPQHEYFYNTDKSDSTANSNNSAKLARNVNWNLSTAWPHYILPKSHAICISRLCAGRHLSRIHINSSSHSIFTAKRVRIKGNCNLTLIRGPPSSSFTIPVRAY
jgi:hypothetical protein